MYVVITFVLVIAGVVCESLGETFLKNTEALTRLRPLLFCLIFYAGSFVLGAYLLQRVPMGVLYALWSGLGVFLTSFLDYTVYKQSLDMPAIIGLVLIVAGLALISIFSNSISIE